MSEYAKRLPLRDHEAFADWLIMGLEKFNASWRLREIGVTDAFPGYTFSINRDIPSQFSAFFFSLDPRERSCVRRGIESALRRFEVSRNFWYGTCVDLIRLALNFYPQLIVRAAPALMEMAREAASVDSINSDSEILYANIVSAVGAQTRFDPTVLNLLENEVTHAKAVFPRVLPLLCITIATLKPDLWATQLSTAALATWPTARNVDEPIRGAFFDLVRNFGGIATARHIADQLQDVYAELKGSKERISLLLKAMFPSEMTTLMISRNPDHAAKPFLIRSSEVAMSYPVRFDRLVPLDQNQLEAALSLFVNKSLEHNLDQLAA